MGQSHSCLLVEHVLNCCGPPVAEQHKGVRQNELGAQWRRRRLTFPYSEELFWSVKYETVVKTVTAEASTMTSPCPAGASLACFAWDNTEWTEKHESLRLVCACAHTHIQKALVSKCNTTLTLPQRAKGGQSTLTGEQMRARTRTHTKVLGEGLLVVGGNCPTSVSLGWFCTRTQLLLERRSTKVCRKLLLTRSVCWWMEPEWWQSWTVAKAAPAGSLCWCRGWPSVNGNAGAGLGPLGRAAGCSAQARRQPGFREQVHLAREFNCLHIFSGGGSGRNQGQKGDFSA